jgi:separase
MNSEEHLLQAQEISSEEKERSSKLSQPAKPQERSRQDQLVADAYRLCSILAVERGMPHLALVHAKQSVKVMRRAWTSIEDHAPQLTSTCSHSKTSTEKLAEDVSHLSLSIIAVPSSEKRQSHTGSEFWAIITPLFQSLSHLSEIYAHHGMFQETMYYAEQALKLVKRVGSKMHAAIASAYLGSVWLKAGAFDKGAEYLMGAKDLGLSKEYNKDTALLAYRLGNMHGLLGDPKAELAAYEEVEEGLKNLTKKDFINEVDQIIDPAEALEKKMSRPAASKSKAPARKAATRSKAPASRKTANRATTPIDIVSSVTEECPELMSLKAMVLRQKAWTLTCTKGFADALGLLQEAETYSKSQIDTVHHGLAMAKRLLLQSMEQMNADPLYSVLQESTISFPAVMAQLRPDKSTGERLSSTRLSPSGNAKNGKNGADRAGLKSPPPESFIDKLRQAQEHLVEVHSVAFMTAPMAVIHSISTLLNSVAMLLSAAAQGKANHLAHPAFASCLIGMLPCALSPRHIPANRARNGENPCTSPRTQSNTS